MKKVLKNVVVDEIKKKYDPAFYIDDSEWDETLEQVQHHLLANKFYFLKDVSYEDFIESIWQYIHLKRTRLK
ncbi:MAG: hypothetical protein ACOYVK_13185 [Bacillota bacterium]